MKKYLKIVLASLSTLLIISCTEFVTNADDTSNNPNTVIQNPFGFPGFLTSPFQTTMGYSKNHIQNYPGYLDGNLISNNNIHIGFKTESYLPTSLSRHNGDLSNPQSLAISPDGNTAFLTVTTSKSNGYGHIIKYNLGDLNNRFHTNISGSMGLIRSAGNWNHRILRDTARVSSYKKKLKKARKHHKRVSYYSNKLKWAKIDLKRDKKNKPSKNYVNSCKKSLSKKQKIAKHSKSKKAKKAVAEAKRKLRNAKRTYRQNVSASKHSTKKFKYILRDIKVGPNFYIGHGQSVAYNPAQGNLWFMNYEGQPYFQNIDPNSLKPQNKITMTGDINHLGHSLAFDQTGHAWFWGVNENKTVGIYEGTLNESNIHFKLRKTFRQGPGAMQQASAFNPQNNRFYLASDGSLMSVKINDVGNDDASIESDSVQNTWIQGKRETEGLSFDNSGNAYLLVNRGPEILQSSDYIGK